MSPITSREAAALLGVEINVPIIELKKAWRRLAQMYHPDHNPSKEAEKKFKKLNAAYTLLSSISPGGRESKAIEDEIMESEFERWIRDLPEEEQNEINAVLRELD